MIGANYKSSSMMRRDRAGYTLVEMLVAVSIFTLAFSAIGAIFVSFTLAQSRANQSQQTLGEANFLMESIAREIRMSAIDYDHGCFTPGIDTDKIALINEDGTQVHFYYDATNKNIHVLKQAEISASACVDASSPQLNADFLSVMAMNMRLFPSESPTQDDPIDAVIYQPLVVIEMSLEAGQGRSLVHYDMQTTVTSRYYGL